MNKRFYVVLELREDDADAIPPTRRVKDLFEELISNHTAWSLDDLDVYEFWDQVGKGSGRST